ncbi:MAG: serine/threonine protein kinase [Phycisphaerales bacterium]|nr:serine/threonine protein kinase [Phycisphaerales bacterium]
MSSYESSDRYRQVEGAFQRAMDLPQDRRAEFLTRYCGTDTVLRSAVESLLRCHSAAGTAFDQPLFVRPAHAANGDPVQIGRYRVERRLGQGGMAVVFEAQQDQPRRRVAIKLLLPGAATERSRNRIAFEADVLARLQHPGIAQVYDAGFADVRYPTGEYAQQPFVALELVQGETLIRHASAGRLDLEQRLQLFLKICDAVQHAHQHGVIHRDLKPGNILVDPSGQPKVLDFGVARILTPESEISTQQTMAVQFIGTLRYMSPEQARGDQAQVDTRTDIYSLGTILYELLSGSPPHDLAELPLHEAIRTICEAAPARLASVDRDLCGDLDTILSKAIEKDPVRRYQSVGEFSGDLRRYLRREPITARPPTVLYSISRFSRRNRGLVIGAALALASLIIGTIATATFAWRASRSAEVAKGNEARARAAAARADAVVQMLLDVVRSPDPELVRGPGFTVRELLDEVSAQVSQRFRDQPETEAAMHATLGKTYRAIGLVEKARPHLQAALSLRRQLFGENHLEVADSQHALASLLTECGEFDAAQELFQLALQIRRRLVKGDDSQVADVLLDLAGLKSDQRLHGEAESLCREALRIYRSTGGDDAPGIAACLERLGYIARAGRRFAEAEDYFRNSLDHNRRRFGERHPAVFMSQKNLAALLRITKRYDEAETLYQESLAGVRELLGPDHPHVALVLNSIANLRHRQGRFDEGEATFEEALAIYRKAYAGDAVSIAVCLQNYALLLASRGEPARAADSARQALEMRRRMHPESHEKVTAGVVAVASYLAASGDISAAVDVWRDAIRRARSLTTNDHWILGRRLYDFGRLLIEYGDTSEGRMTWLNEAEEVLLEAQEIASEHYPLNQWRAYWLATTLADLYEKRNETDQAARWRARSVAVRPAPDAAPAASADSDE